MKWLFILLLLGNVFYFGWELDRQTRVSIINSTTAIPIPKGTEELKLLSELEEPPPLIASRPATIPTGARQDQEPDAGNEYAASPAGMEDAGGIAEQQDTGMQLLTSLPGVNVAELSKELEKSETLCFSYGPMDDAEESEKLESWFQTRHISVNHRQTDEKGRQLFWIYLTPRNNRENAVAAIKDLKNRGVTDLRLISSGELVNAISLGLFSTQASVNRRLREIADMGYKPVVIPHYGGRKIHWLDIRLDKKTPVLNEIIEGFPARYNSVPVTCNEIAISTVNP